MAVKMEVKTDWNAIVEVQYKILGDGLDVRGRGEREKNQERLPHFQGRRLGDNHLL